MVGVVIAGISAVTVMVVGFCSPMGRIVHGHGFIGIIMDDPHNPLYPPYTATWPVEPAHIRKMEDNFAAYIQKDESLDGTIVRSELPSFRRRYFGLATGKSRVIVVTAVNKAVQSR